VEDSGESAVGGCAGESGGFDENFLQGLHSLLAVGCGTGLCRDEVGPQQWVVPEPVRAGEVPQRGFHSGGEFLLVQNEDYARLVRFGEFRGFADLPGGQQRNPGGRWDSRQSC
jgi:hypothetical protein